MKLRRDWPLLILIGGNIAVWIAVFVRNPMEVPNTAQRITVANLAAMCVSVLFSIATLIYHMGWMRAFHRRSQDDGTLIRRQAPKGDGR